MKVLLIIDVIGFIIYWFNAFVLLGKVLDHQESGHNARKTQSNGLTRFLNNVRFIFISLVPILNLIVGILFSSKAVFNAVIEDRFED